MTKRAAVAPGAPDVGPAGATPAAPGLYDDPHVYDVLFTPWEGDPTISDEFPKGDRGIILNQFIALRAQVDATATTAGPRPAESFNQLLVDAFGHTVGVTKVSGFYLYKTFEQGDYGRAAAMSFLLLIVAFTISVLNARLLRSEKV